MGIFNEFYKKEKPVFTGSRFGFGSGDSGGAAAGPGFSASGGNIADGVTPGDGYAYHTFGASGALVISGSGTCDILVVAGGGGGGGRAGGGGGAGGVVEVVNVPLTAGSYAVSVGAAGAGAGQPGHPTYPDNQNNSPQPGANGTNSYFGAPGSSIGGQPDYFLAKGGGGGGKGSSVTGNPGGSSGGSGYGTDDPPAGTQPGTNPSPFATDYGYRGGRGVGNPTYNCGGGGGSGQVGYPGVPKNGDGGDGQPFPRFEYPKCFPSPYIPALSPKSPNSTHYAGGGGGGGHPPQGPHGVGGAGGGGNGGSPGGPFPTGNSSAGTQAGVDYLGAGGGGTSTDGSPPQNYFGKPGGKGVVIIRYAV